MNDKICPQCQIELRPLKNGVVVVEMSTCGPLAIWRGDAWHCPKCKKSAIIGLGDEPEIRNCAPEANALAFQARLDSYDLDPKIVVVRYWQNEREKEEYLKNCAEDVLSRLTKRAY